MIDIARWCLVPTCGEIVKFNSVVTHTHQAIFDETVMVACEFESGATCQLFCSVTMSSPFKLELYTEKSTIVGDHLVNDNRAIWIDQQPLLFEKNNPYISQLDNFISSIQNNRAPEVGFEEGLKNVEHLLKIWPK